MKRKDQGIIVIPKVELEIIFLELTTTISKLADKGDKDGLKFLKINLSPLMQVLYKMSVLVVGSGKAIVPNVTDAQIKAIAGMEKYANLRVQSIRTWPNVFYLSVRR